MGRWPSPERSCVDAFDAGHSYGKHRSRGTLRNGFLSTTWLTLPLVAASLALPQTARAANDACVVVGAVATCTGNQADGVSYASGSGITTLNVQSLTLPIQPATTVPGIALQQAGADGVNPGDNGVAGAALSVNADGTVVISTQGASAHGISVTSTGGNGQSDPNLGGGLGGNGGNGGDITIVSDAQIGGSGAGSAGIFAQTAGGAGNFGFGGVGAAGNGGNISITNTGAIAMTGASSVGISATSISGSTFGGAVGSGGTVSVTNSGAISTGATGSNAHGIFAHSYGLGGGDGADTSGVTADGGGGGTGQNGGAVTIANSGPVATTADSSHGLYALSEGGKGGSGGHASGASAHGGGGGQGGNAGIITVTNSGVIAVTGAGSYGIYAASFGADGGSGGGASELVAGGGAGGTGGVGSNVTVTTTSASNITTEGDASHGIYAISRGGGGGGAGNAGAFYGEGGGAGAGGIPGVVTVTMAGAIVTHGVGSYGILAESTGGGGGSGGSGSGVIGVGSGGGAASPGGIVNVTVNGDITTTGDLSHAVVASSIGGGGGNGGGSGGLVSIGGGGSSSGSADHVTVINNGTLTTEGVGAYGIFAQSVGGGGGNGGNSGGWVSIGGSGGAGGDGGQVDVTNNNLIKTTGAYGHGIYAQSVGGGGGDGGYANSYGGFLGTTISVGGSGGDGGAGKAVNVTNVGTIIVSGYHSTAIYGQSIGGGGGNGGDATSIGVSPISVAIGGSGGKGGAGGAVTIDNTGLLVTQGDRASAVFAQSVGGGGGTGGSGFAISANVIAIAVAVGGSGGDGGAGDSVTVNQNGAILTAGTNSYGIFAQSVGGGGGDGGSAAAVAISASPKESASIAVAVGGTGGTGGNGGAVDVTNTGSVVTLGAGSIGVFAQSVGGGGGNGGSADSTAVVIFAAKDNLAAAVSVGGSGGTAGNGGAVVVNNIGRIITVGDDAHGIQAQSVGGGGGNGGAGRATAMASSGPDINLKDYADKVIAIVNGVTRSDTLPETPDVPFFPDLPDAKDKKKADDTKKDEKKEEGESKSVALSIGVGGKGGAAGDGGTVTVNNVGRIDTYGFMSYGIFAQSVGGGGGEGGGGSSSAGAGSVNVGGGFGNTGGSSGNGGDVSVTNTGIIATRGHDAIGIVAQSVGGGGGVGGAGDANAGLDPTSIAVSVGGQGGSSGDGSHVTIQQSGDIATVGDRAYGVLAQSIGGGGGVGGVGTAGNAGTVFVGGNGGGGGTGGQVDVTVSGNITTFGLSAHGVLAQSVGGGGGIGGDLSGDILTVGIGVGGAAGNAGNGGTVNVTTTGTIVTRGMRAFGILAQSIGGGGGLGGGSSGGSPFTASFAGSNGGNGIGGAINITHTGSVVAFGEGSHAIFAQSTGLAGAGGNITIALHGGTISGGTGDAAGLYIDGGATNTVTLSSGAMLTALSGLALKATGAGSNTVNNSANVVGDVDMDASFNAFNNLVGGVFVTKTMINLNGGMLSNAGRLDLGGYKNVVSAALTGSFTQLGVGTLALDARFGGGPSDLLSVTGTATVRGFVMPTTLALVPNAPVTILTAAGGFTGTNDAHTINTPIITYGLQYVGNNLQLTVQNVNFVPAAFAGGMNPNEQNVANHLQGVWNTGVPSTLAGTMGYLVNSTTAAGYTGTLDQLLPASYLAQQTAAVAAGLGFLDGMMSCHSATGSLSVLREQECSWARFTGSVATQQSNADTFGYRETGERYQAGVQTQVAPNWFRGLAASFQSAHTTVGSVATSNSQRFDVGMSAKYQTGNWLFAGALDLGAASTDTTRFISFAGATANSRSAVWHADARLRAAYLVEAGPAYMKPSVDLDLIHLSMPAFSETGAGSLNLNVDSMSKTLGVITPAIEFGTTMNDGAATAVVRHFVSGGVSWYTDKTWTVSSTFEGTPVGVPSFATSTAFPDMIYKVGAGLDFISKKPTGGVDLRFVYDGQFANGFQSHSGSVKASMRF